MRRSVILVAIWLTLSSCNVAANLRDGYQFGDVTTGMVQNYKDYCSPQYKRIRFFGRVVVRLAVGPLPEGCPKTN